MRSDAKISKMQPNKIELPSSHPEGSDRPIELFALKDWLRSCNLLLSAFSLLVGLDLAQEDFFVATA